MSLSIDIVVVTFNSSDCLPACLDALEPLLDSGAQLVVVDNGSQDASVDLVERRYPFATVIRNTANLGFAAAVNMGIQAGTSEVVLLVNPDVEAITGDPAAALCHFRSDQTVAAVAGAITLPSGHIVRSCHLQPTAWFVLLETLAVRKRFPAWGPGQRFRMLDWDMRSERDVEDASGGFLFLSRRALAEVGLFDERFFLYYEESDWLARARGRSFRVVFTPVISAVHESGHSSDEPSESLSNLLLESSYIFVAKHEGWVKCVALRSALAAFDSARWVRYALRSPGLHASARRREAGRRLGIHLGIRRAHRAGVRA